jgi:putative oxidoreductase
MRNAITWLLSLVLSLAFVIVGLGNITLQPRMVQRFHNYGYPLWFIVLTGAIEIFGAALVLIPRTSYIGAGLLACITCGAFISQMANGQTRLIAAPIALFLLALVVGTLHDWGRAREE